MDTYRNIQDIKELSIFWNEYAVKKLILADLRPMFCNRNQGFLWNRHIRFVLRGRLILIWSLKRREFVNPCLPLICWTACQKSWTEEKILLSKSGCGTGVVRQNPWPRFVMPWYLFCLKQISWPPYVSSLHIRLKAVYTFLFRSYGTCHIWQAVFYRYYVPNWTKGAWF